MKTSKLIQVEVNTQALNGIMWVKVKGSWQRDAGPSAGRVRFVKLCKNSNRSSVLSGRISPSCSRWRTRFSESSPPPHLPDRYLRRERLLQRLQEGLFPVHRLTMLGAAAGTGKTTLLADYYGVSAGVRLWLSLTPSESDSVVFFRSLLTALHRLLPSLPSAALEVVETLGNRGLVQAASLLCDELLEHLSDPLLLVIDNAQHLPSTQEAQEALEILIRFFPEESQVILSGRSLPPLKLAHYRLGGQMVELGAEALAFTHEEVAQLLFAKAGGLASDELVGKLYDRTKGWVTGVVYALAPFGAEALRASEGEITTKRLEQPELLYAYLAEEIFDRLPGDFQDQLLFASFLPYLDPELCRFAMGPEADAFMEALPFHQAFVTETEGGFQFHPIFREFLQREALVRWRREQRAALLKRLAEAASSSDEEIRLLQLAEDWEGAECRLVAALPALLKEGRLGTIQALSEAFSIPWRKKSAWLNYIEGELARRAGNLSRAIEILQAAEAFRAEEQQESPVPWIWASLSAAHGARGEYEQQRAYAQRALQADLPLPSAPSAFCYNVLGLYHLAIGDLSAAKENLQKAMDLYRASDDIEGKARVLHNLGLAFAKEGDFSCAIGFYRESIRHAEQGGRIPLPMTLNNLALCHLYLGHFVEGWQAVEKGMALAERIASGRERIYLLWTMGQFYVHQELALKARDCFETSLEEAIQTGDHLSQLNAHLGMAEVYVRQQDARSAEAALERAQALAGKPLHDPEMLEAALLQVEVHLCAQQQDRAGRGLEEIEANLRQIQNHYQDFHFERLSHSWCLACGRPREAEAHWGKIQALSDRYGYPLPPRPDSRPAEASVAPPPALQVTCLGQFEAKVDGLTVRSRDWKSNNSKVVLVYLLLNPAGVTKDQLLNLLYPNETPARSALPTVVARLRQALEPELERGATSRFIRFQDGRYYLNRGLNLRFDVLEFQQACQEARQPALSDDDRKAYCLEAVRLYQGPFMEGFHDLTWCMIEGERLRRLAVEAYEELFALLGKQGEWLSIETNADALLNLEPCSESAYRAKMVALVMQDRWEDALRVGHLSIQVLMSSLRQATEPETTELIDLIQTERLTVRDAQAFLSR